MGIAAAACNPWRSGLSVPDLDRSTYFSEKLLTGWYELLCCPTAMGCTVLHFQPGKGANGGEAQYKAKLRLSHSEHVPRYQLHVVSQGKTKQWIVGHMEKTETHLRVKAGEFFGVQVWKLTCNAMVLEGPESGHRSGTCGREAVRQAVPSARDMLSMGFSIATQAKLDLAEDSTGEREIYDKKTERWVQTVGVDNKAYKLNIEAPKHSTIATAGKLSHVNMKSMSVLRILHKGKKVCIARKQRFAGALGMVEQPYLGVQLRPADVPQRAEADGQEGVCHQMLDTQVLMLLLMCLAWSEETMSPVLGHTDRFARAMCVPRGSRGSLASLGVSEDWTFNEMQQRLQGIPYVALHEWHEPGDDQDDMGYTDEGQSEG